jgi:mannose-P-dolichol utilization defect 1
MPRVTTALAFTVMAALAATVVSSETDAAASSDSTELLFGVITPKCYDAFVQHHDFGNTECIKFVISKLLSYAIISGAFILKLPQILKIVAAKDVTGLTPSSFYMEVVLCASSSAYNLLRGYPLSTWGETLVILAQNIILVMLLWAYHVPKIGYSTRLGLTIVFGLASAAMMLTPPEHQWLLMSASIPVTIVARAPQVHSFSLRPVMQRCSRSVSLY